MDILDMLHGRNFAGSLKRILDTFKTNVQHLEKEFQDFKMSIFREMEDRAGDYAQLRKAVENQQASIADIYALLSRQERRMRHLEHITTIIIDEEQKQAKRQRQDPAPSQGT